MCSIDCADGLCDVLASTGKYRVKMVGPDSHPYLELTSKLLEQAYCLAVPGGLGDADQFDGSLLQTLKPDIQSYVAAGGRYLGICMGSYYASYHYLDLLDKGTKSVQYVKRKKHTVNHEDHDVVDLTWLGEEKTMYFYDGAAFVPRGFFDKVRGEVIARYHNGDAAALIQKFRYGKVGVIGPHPEAHKWWFYSSPRITHYWHSAVHHELLIDFVQKLFED
jgi:glutamine amidotransferase-like uncharacterized protein